MSIEIRELVVKSSVRWSGKDDHDAQAAEASLSRSELLEECRKMVAQMVAQSRRR